MFLQSMVSFAISLCGYLTIFRTGIFPGRGNTIWRDWYTHEVVDYIVGANTTLSAPLGHINVHVRDGAAILLHTTPGYTIEETRQSDYSLLVHLNSNGIASGKAYIDDGESLPPTPYKEVEFLSDNGKAEIKVIGYYTVKQKLTEITVLVNGVTNSSPAVVTVGGKQVKNVSWNLQKGELAIKGLEVDLNKNTTISWSL
jgi:alpha-glucosidase